MTERQKTGVWSIVVGALLLLIWVLSYAIQNVLIDSKFLAISTWNLSDEQRYVLGASSVVTLQLISLTGIPFILVGIAQVLLGAQKNPKKKNSAR